MISTQIVALSADESEFPERLRELSVVPDPLFAIGDVSLLNMPMIAIVGTRNPTSYGLRVARSIATALAEAGVVVVSGMARGIDAAAHHAALDAGGSTIAVLGTGVDVPYPVGHAELHRVISERGLLVSECGAGEIAHKGSFPKRNRIIAALGRATIVIEAGFKSGARNTANHALELGRALAAVPGPIDSDQSAGTNLLLRDGAIAITCVSDALALAGVKGVRQREPSNLSPGDAKVWTVIGGETLSIDTISERAGLPPRECLEAVTSLELAGLVESLITGDVRRR